MHACAVDTERASSPISPAAAAIVVLPLKILRGDPHSDFLAFSLPDAIAASLADHPHLSVRPPLTAARHAGADANLATLASALHVSYALTGTLTDVRGRIAVRLQLLEVPAGTVLAEKYLTGRDLNPSLPDYVFDV